MYIPTFYFNFRNLLTISQRGSWVNTFIQVNRRSVKKRRSFFLPSSQLFGEALNKKTG